MTILLADDDEAILNVVRDILEWLGHRVLAAGTPRDAVSLATAHGDGIDLLITDIVMPGMDGYRLAEAVDERVPGIPVLFITGYADHLRPAERFRAAPVLRKPFTKNDLDRAIRAIPPARSWRLGRPPDPASSCAPSESRRSPNRM